MAAIVSDAILGETQGVELLLGLVLEGTGDDLDSFVANVVAGEVKLSDCLATLENALKLIKSIECDVILPEGQHLEVSLFTEGLAEGCCSLWENSIA